MHCPKSSFVGPKQQLSTVEGHRRIDWRYRQQFADYLPGFKFLTNLDTYLATELSRPELVKA